MFGEKSVLLGEDVEEVKAPRQSKWATVALCLAMVATGAVGYSAGQAKAMQLDANVNDYGDYGDNGDNGGATGSNYKAMMDAQRKGTRAPRAITTTMISRAIGKTGTAAPRDPVTHQSNGFGKVGTKGGRLVANSDPDHRVPTHLSKLVGTHAPRNTDIPRAPMAGTRAPQYMTHNEANYVNHQPRQGTKASKSGMRTTGNNRSPVAKQEGEAHRDALIEDQQYANIETASPGI